MQPKKRLAIVCRTGDSGLTDYSICLIRQLKLQFDISFFTAHSALRHPARGDIDISPVFRRFRQLPIDFLGFVAAVLRFRPWAVVFQSWVGSPLIDGLLARVLRWLGIRTAVTVHDVMPHHPRPWSRASCGFFYRSFDLLIAHSNSSCELLHGMGVKGSVLVVPHGEYSIFDTDSLDREEARSRLCAEISGSRYIALFFGHLDERKGLLEFLEVASQLGGSSMHFIVAGQNDLSPGGRAQLAAFSSPFTKIDIGHVPFEMVQVYFSAADVIVLPYREGTTSGVLKIAMAFNKPVIASAVGDIPETLEEWPGILIDPQNLVTDLSEALQRAAANPIAAFGNIQKPASKFDWKPIGKAYAEFLLSGTTNHV